MNTHGDNDDSDDWCYVVGNYAKESTKIDLLNHDFHTPKESTKIDLLNHDFHTPEATAATELRGSSLWRCSVLID